MNDFSPLNIPDKLRSSLNRINIKKMTPIQSRSIPVALEGKDIFGCSQTGTGKTIAFLIPVMAKILRCTTDQALILTPTRELAKQIEDVVKKLSHDINNRISTLLIGGMPIFKQVKRLKTSDRIVIGTPGRVLDHLKRKSLILEKLSLLVIDESDRMLDMGFSEQLNYILKHLPNKRQTLMFSATFSPQIINLSKKYLSNPANITVGAPNKPIDKIKQETIYTKFDNKYSTLLKQIDNREGSIIIFVNTKVEAEKLSKKLLKDHCSIGTLHGDVVYRKRERVMSNFRAKKIRIMVATDIASRGLDISHISHVINYDFPTSKEDYIHRIGRTGRADSDGQALNLILPSEVKKWKSAEKWLSSTQHSSKSTNNKYKDNKYKTNKFKTNRRPSSNKTYKRKK